MCLSLKLLSYCAVLLSFIGPIHETYYQVVRFTWKLGNTYKLEIATEIDSKILAYTSYLASLFLCPQQYYACAIIWDRQPNEGVLIRAWAFRRLFFAITMLSWYTDSVKVLWRCIEWMLMIKITPKHKIYCIALATYCICVWFIHMKEKSSYLAYTILVYRT